MPAGTQVQNVGGKFSSGAQWRPSPQFPLHCAYVSPHGVAIEVEVVEEEVVVVLVLVDVAVVLGTQSPFPHASQQLDTVPTHAVPPFGARQRAASFFTLHFNRPAALARQQVAAPGFPQVERAAHFFTAPLQALRSWPEPTRTVSTAEAQRT